MVERFDAVVIGGGPSGAVAGLLLARAGWSVLLFERKEFPRRKLCGEFLSATNRPLLSELGVAAAFDNQAGPEVKRVGLFLGTTSLHADLPRCRGHSGWGRALRREHLDTLLLHQAAEEGVDVRQPWSVVHLMKEGNTWRGRAKLQTENSRNKNTVSSCAGPTAAAANAVEFSSPILIAAHGSWDAGDLPSQSARLPSKASDLFGFKAHFRASKLPPDLMPLLAFPGGYGGMVHTDDETISLSCCIRRDVLQRCRTSADGNAGDVVLRYIKNCCRGARETLEDAQLDGPWLAAGPIRPGRRLRQPAGLFPVGNLAGEAHPVIAEGISMAMQSSWLLANLLIRRQRQGACADSLESTASAYARAFRRAFAPRQLAASLIAHWAMSPVATGSTPLLRCFPGILTWSARATGKAQRLVTG